MVIKRRPETASFLRGEIMDTQRQREELKEKVKKKFYGHDTLRGKGAVQVPQSADREYERMIDAYMKTLKTELERELPNLRKEYAKQHQQEITDKHRADSSDDFMKELADILHRIENKILKAMGAFELKKRLERIAKLSAKLSTAEWKRLVKRTLGIDIMEDYYNGEFYQEAVDKWVSENVDLITTIPQDTLGNMKETIYAGWNQGLSTADIAKNITKDYAVSKKHAKFIARDQMAKLNCDITKKQHEDAGVSEYIWDDSRDERVRPWHRILNGQKFKWSDPPEMMELRKGQWVGTGRHCHPGQDYNCRCVATPVFAYDDLDFAEGVNVENETK